MGFGLGSIKKGIGKIAKGAFKATTIPWQYDTLNEWGGSAKSKLGSLKNIGKVDIPPTPEPTVMPVGDEEEMRRQRKRLIASQAARSGRTSTILTGDSQESLG